MRTRRLPEPASTNVIIPRRDRSTLTIGEAAALLGVGQSTAYEQIRTDGALIGVPVLRVGSRRVLPKRAFFRALGLDEETGQ